MATDAPLKRLAFVQGYTGSAITVAENVYKKARTYVPGAVEPYVRTAEDKATQVAAPYLTWAQDTSEKVLRTADGQVRGEMIFLRASAAEARGGEGAVVAKQGKKRARWRAPCFF
jgi:hypothetical protein